MAKSLPPLNGNTPITDEKGRPRPAFVLLINQLLNSSVASALALAQQALTLAQQALTAVNALIPRVEDLEDAELIAGVGLGGGGMVGDAPLTFDLEDTTVTPDTYGDATNVPQITVDAQGRITDVTLVPITGGGGGGGGGNLVKLAQIVVTSATPSVTFNAISQLYDDLVIVFQVGVTTVNAATRLLMQVNGDTGGHYDWDYWDRYGNTGPTYNASAIALDEIPPQKTSGTIDGTKSGSIEIFAYAGAHKPKMASSHSTMRYVPSGGFGDDVIPGMAVGNWNDASAVTSVTLAASANNLDVGSVFTLYGRGGPSGGGGGSGALTLIQRQTLASPASTIAFTAIPGTFTDLLLSISARSSAAALAADVNVQFNGDTGNNYEAWNDNRFGGGQTIPTSAPTISTVEAATSPLYCFPSEILIPGYAITAFYKSAQSMGGTRDSNLYRQNRGLAWLNTNAITDILLTLTSGNFVVGSVFSLYGRN